MKINNLFKFSLICILFFNTINGYSQGILGKKIPDNDMPSAGVDYKTTPERQKRMMQSSIEIKKGFEDLDNLRDQQKIILDAMGVVIKQQDSLKLCIVKEKINSSILKLKKNSEHLNNNENETLQSYLLMKSEFDQKIKKLNITCPE